ncbi:hypothetical protein [Streptomyces sp. CB02115]|uniref:hypothetical protein n=1 Tax=Streptomyces sp. CB02115 TaxID=1703939 RepID=UPI00093FC5C5|nr:hypothetical protein [Streptomyces sp. CB02115]OKJ55955.1 hypothetical protein AMK28_13910 [Streptomyces sp. CB02115]
MTETLTPAADAFFVVAEVIHGPHLAPRVDGNVYCSPECAAHGVRELVNDLREEEGGSGLVLPHRGRLTGCVVTPSSRMWAVSILAHSELPAV